MSFKTLVAATSLSLLCINPIFADSISVQGIGVISTAPDIAYINLGVSSNAKTARIALDKNNKAMNIIITAIKKINVEAEDIRTSNFSISPRYNRSKIANSLPTIIGYEVFNTLNVTIRNLDSLGPLLDKVVTVGSNRINNIRFAISNPQPLKDQARALAAKDAQRRAQIYANTMGFNLGKIVNVIENSSDSGIYTDQIAIMRQGASTPIEAGAQSVSVNVTVEWEIEQ